MERRPPLAGGARLFDSLLGGVTAGIAAVWLLRLGAQAVRGTFATDECFHAYVAEFILQHHTLPARLPEFYSGLASYYPPVLHLAGALWAAVLGLPALHLLPIAFAGLTLAALLWGGAGVVPASARRWAVLLCLLNASLAIDAVRFYAEAPSTLLTIAAVVLTIRMQRGGGFGLPIATGVIAGMAVNAKITGWLLVPLLLAIALADVARGRRGEAVRPLIAAAVAIAIGLPWLIRNQVLFGSALYPAFVPDIDRALLALNQRHFSTPLPRFLLGIPPYLGIPMLLMLAAAVVMAFRARRFSMPEALLVFAVAGMLIVTLLPMAATRHLDLFVPVMALAACWIVSDALGSRAGARLAIEGALLVLALVGVVRIPDRRASVDEPAYLQRAFGEIAPRVPEGATILSLWTYDTFYYTRRPATWPNPWGATRITPIFEERDPDRFLAGLRQAHIDYMLVPRRIQPVAFNTANYPESFMNCVKELIGRRTVPVVWASDELMLLKVPAGP